jgi:hypothetical protein
VVCNANAHIVVFQSLEDGKTLQEKYRFEADFAVKDATIVRIILRRMPSVFQRVERSSAWVAMIQLLDSLDWEKKMPIWYTATRPTAIQSKT